MRDGLRGDCKACAKISKRERYLKNRQREIDRAKEWQAANPERHAENQRRRRERPDVKLREREGHLLRKFGMTLAQYEQLFAAQGGVCALCGKPPTPGISLHVDHDHSTGILRGLLCFKCNNALGDYDDDPERLRAAASYLDRPDEETVSLTKARLRSLVASSA